MKSFVDRMPSGAIVFALNMLLLVHFVEQTGYPKQQRSRPLNNQVIAANTLLDVDVQYVQKEKGEGRRQICQILAPLFGTPDFEIIIFAGDIVREPRTATRFQNKLISTLFDSSYL